MISLRPCTRACKILTLITVSLATALAYAQRLSSNSDAEQIPNLLLGLSDHSKAPGDALDPALTGSEREKNLKRFGTAHFDLSLVPINGIRTITGESASVPIRVHFSSEDGNQLDANAMAYFIKRNGKWYFSNFDFLGWPSTLIVVLVIGILVGIAYAATVLILRSRVVRKGLSGLDEVKLFLPIFWPGLFRRTR